MATRYKLEFTFGGDESEAPQGWEQEALYTISNMVNRGYVCGEFPIYENDKAHRGFWNLEAEDE